MTSAYKMTLALMTSLLLITQILAQEPQEPQEEPQGSCGVGCEGSCCSNFIMDNPRKEVIDFNLTVSRGVYYGVALKLCKEQQFSIGLWVPDPVRADIMELLYTASYPGIDNEWKKIILRGETYYAMNFTQPWNVTSTVYFGIGVMGMLPIVPIPYKSAPNGYSSSKDPPFYDLWLGNTFRGTAEERVERSSAIILEYYPWPRTFKDFVHFCTAPGCLDEAHLVSRGPRGFPGRPGPKGPVGPPGLPGQIAPGFAGCDDPDSEFANKLNSIASQTQKIINSISKVETDVNKLNRGERDTGKCPRNYVSGTYGLGSCYFFWLRQSKSFGESALGCVSTERSHLIDIQSEEEDSFLAEVVGKKMRDGETNITFFTSGLYSKRYQSWVWYSDQVLKRMPLVHNNWAVGEENGFLNGETCLAVRVFRDKTIDWISTKCTETHGYICKRAKKCY